MSKHPYGANAEMLLLLAWLSTHDLAGLVRKDRETRPWKRPPSWDSSQYPSFPEGLLREQVETALGCFHHDPIYGPVLEALARERLTYINFALLSWAIELQNLTKAASAFHISNDAYYARREQKSEGVDETDVFWRVACAHAPLADRLKCLSTTWHREICVGASELRIFFIWYMDKIQGLLHVPFFLVEYVRISLLKIDWHRIAENLLDVPHLARGNCRCTAGAQEIATGTITEKKIKAFNEGKK